MRIIPGEKEPFQRPAISLLGFVLPDAMAPSANRERENTLDMTIGLFMACTCEENLSERSRGFFAQPIAL